MNAKNDRWRTKARAHRTRARASRAHWISSNAHSTLRAHALKAKERMENASRACATALALTCVMSAAGVFPERALATTARDTGACLLQNCAKELASCVSDEKCLEDLVCLQGCFGTPDEADCQIRCGDLYASKAVGTFNTCAVTEKSCVAQRKDEGLYPVPSFDALAKGFTLDMMPKYKRWYIVAGLNKDFDTFDCQEHFFTKGEDGKMYIKINWRVSRPNGQFYERSDVQRFYQEPDGKAILHNNGNVMLHYQDDWYIPAFKEGEWVFIYYRGTNDAWDGYGGATVYSTSPTLKPEWIPEIEAAARKVGVKWSDFVITDNSCKAAPELKLTKPTDLDTLADDAYVLEKDLQNEASFIEKLVAGDFKRAERFVGKEVQTIEQKIELLERNLLSAGPGRPTGLVPDKAVVVDKKTSREFDRASSTLDKIEDQFSRD